MTTPKDIIGIVKELQELNDRWIACELPTHKYTAAMEEHFPSIAQALLIAVETLEDIQRSADTLGDDYQMYLAGIETEARHALSRIRSLHP